jgi:hypothetical protein
MENSTGHQGVSTGVLAVIFLTMMIVRSQGLLGRWERTALARGRERFAHDVHALPGRKLAQKGG